MLSMVEDPSEFLTVGGAAEYLGVSPQTLRRWDAAGKLKAVRRPGSEYRYYRRADLEPFRLQYRRAEMQSSTVGGPMPRAANNPAHMLAGMTLAGGWKVIRPVERHPLATGAHFSQGYIVEKDDGTEGFLKALDYSLALGAPNRAETLKNLTSAYLFERDLCAKCRSHRLTRVVAAIDDGEVLVDPDHILGEVDYLIFEKADGDVRTVMASWESFDTAWVLRALHHVSIGLRQLHGQTVAHQDVKPSNVVVFHGNSSKITDLGRAAEKGNPQPYDDYDIAGDPSYAPPELLYRYIDPDWNTRRLGCDLYLLGSLATFFFAEMSMTGLILANLPPKLHWDTWPGTYAEVLPYLESGFAKSLRSLSGDIPELVRPELTSAVRSLCSPDYKERGHPSERILPVADEPSALADAKGNQYSLQRFVSLFDLLASRAEWYMTKG